MKRDRPAAPVRLLHLGLGNFFRAHAAAYTAAAPDSAEWGIAAFGGRSGDLAQRLARQDGLYTLVVRGPVADEFSVIASISAAEADGWRHRFTAPDLAAVTVTVTEFGYRRRDGRRPRC